MAANLINTITIGGLPVYDPTPQMRGTNFFAMHTGAARHGFGQFLMRRADYDTVAASGSSSLVMTSGIDAATQALQAVTIPIIVAGFRMAQAGASTSSDMVWAVVYDIRCTLSGAVNKFYNVLSDADFSTLYPSTQNSGAEHTWASVLADLGVTGTWASLPSWKPRNLIYDEVPLSAVIDDVAARTRTVIGYDYTNTSGSLLSHLLGFWPGVQSSQNASVLANSPVEINSPQSGDSERSTSRKPSSYDFVFPAVASIASDPYASGQRSYIKNIAGSGTGPKRVVHVGEWVALGSSSSWTNQSAMDAVANDLFSRFEAEASCVFDTQTYAGVWPFICDGDIRGILWQSDATGATTTIRRGDDRDFNPLDEITRSSRDAANQLVVAYGSGRVGLGLGRTRFVRAGGGTGVGQFRGQVFTMVSDLRSGWSLPQFIPYVP